MQMLITTLTVCCIPLLVLSARMISDQHNRIEEDQRRRMQETASELAGRFDIMLDNMLKVQTKYATLNELSEQVLSSTVSAEIEAIRTLNYMSILLPFTTESGLVIRGDTDTVYTTKGKYEGYIFAETTLGIPEDKFLSILDDTRTRRFLPWGVCKEYAVYICPVSRGAGASKIYGIYLISRSSLMDSLENLIPETFVLSRITDAAGNDVFVNKATQMTETVRGISKNGYTIHLYAQEMPKATVVSRSLTALVLLTACISLAAAAMSVFLNYKPIHRIIHAVSGERAGGGEMDVIHDAFKNQKDEHQRLLNSYEEQMLMITKRLFRACLNGRSITIPEQRLLERIARSFFVITANTEPSEKAERELYEKHEIHTVVLHADRLCAFICAGLGEERRDREHYAQLIRTHLGLSPQARMTVSTPQRSIEGFWIAYEECNLAMNTMESGTVFAEDIQEGNLWKYSEDSVQMMRTVKELKSGNETVIDQARAMFQAIPLSNGPEYAWKYAAFRVVDYFRRVIQHVEYEVDDIEMARIVGADSLQGVCDRLCILLKRICERRSEAELNAQNEKAEGVIAYIRERCYDSDFGLNEVAEYYDVAVPTASRILKEILGMNFKEYIRNVRMEKAKVLLRSSERTTQQIAADVGFGSLNYFIRVFKSVEGITPTEYRETHLQQSEGEN
ncbi:MAG: helix-turn-helix transcriptional regulator [Clostridia bacterium]|nr:helix-turn-helix transcriptional regulator [Clostridia bacterium]